MSASHILCRLRCERARCPNRDEVRLTAGAQFYGDDSVAAVRLQFDYSFPILQERLAQYIPGAPLQIVLHAASVIPA